MTLIESAILGLVQGLGEFLPISSSAHLIIVPWLMGWQDSGLTFDVSLHFGTLIAVLIFYRAEWISLTRSAFQFRPGHLKGRALSPDIRLILLLVAATIPGALLGLMFEKVIEDQLRFPLLIAFTLPIMGFVLWQMDKRCPQTKTLSDLTLKDALIVGFAQGLALIPGVSRSGATITASRFIGLKRTESARFSFFLAMPITLGACLFKMRHLTFSDINAQFIIGVLVAGVTGFIAIGGLIRYLQKRSYGVFAVYRAIVSLIIFAVVLLKYRQ